MTRTPASSHEILRGLGSIGSATLLSRGLGYVRDMVVALAFCAGPVTDAFFVAYRIPNMLRRLLAEGALSTAMVPVFTDYFVNRPRPEFLRMVRAVLPSNVSGRSGLSTRAGVRPVSSASSRNGTAASRPTR